MTDEFEALDGAIGPHRRDFLKGLVLGAAFASPLVSSFTMSGWLRFVSMRSPILYAGRPRPVFEMIVTGFPVVSCP